MILLLISLNILISQSPGPAFNSQVADTLIVHVVEDDGILEKYGSTFLGVFGSGLVAVLAAFLTYRLSKKQRREKEEEIYRGLLYSIHIELDWQRNHTRLLRDELAELKRLSIEQNRFVVEKAPDSYHTSYIEHCREKMLEYDKFDPPILALLSTYINLLIDTNRFIDFKAARSMENIDTDDMSEESIENYFDTIEDLCLSKIDIAIPAIRSLIEERIKDIPKDLIVNRENIEETKKQQNS